MRASFLLTLLGSAALAQEPLTTDRPTLAESSLAVPRGVYQLEQGVQDEPQSHDEGWSLPTLHRLGLGDGVELRFLSPVLAFENHGLVRPAFTAGLKWNVLPGGESGGRPSVAVIADAVFAKGATIPEVKLALDQELPASLHLNANAGITEYQEHARGLTAVSLGMAFLDQRLSFSVEGSVELERGLGAPGYGIDEGVTFRVTDDVQVDALLYEGLSAASRPSFATLGVSVRFGG